MNIETNETNKQRERILITGAEGMVATHFDLLYGDRYDIRFMSRRPIRGNEYYWDPKSGAFDMKALQGVDHIIHLSGSNLVGHRWTPRYRDEIITSRAGATALIGRVLLASDAHIKTFITASAIGYYGTETSSEIYNEHTPAGDDFLSYVCRAWEEEANLLHYEALVDRVVIARLGLVFAHYGGALPWIATATKFGIAPVLGNGRQFINWIHINDLCRMFHFMIQNPAIHGVYNAVAPDPVTYKKLAKTLAYIRSGDALVVPIPGFFLRRYLDEAAEMLLQGSRVSSRKIQKAGFTFRHPDINNALLHLYDL